MEQIRRAAALRRGCCLSFQRIRGSRATGSHSLPQEVQVDRDTPPEARSMSLFVITKSRIMPSPVHDGR
jgi:hypothetical protein